MGKIYLVILFSHGGSSGFKISGTKIYNLMSFFDIVPARTWYYGKSPCFVFGYDEEPQGFKTISLQQFEEMELHNSEILFTPMMKYLMEFKMFRKEILDKYRTTCIPNIVKKENK
jgi:hypothetical protein